MNDEDRRDDRSPTSAPGLGPTKRSLSGDRGYRQPSTVVRSQIDARSNWRAFWVLLNDHARTYHRGDWTPILDLHLAARRGGLSLREVADQLAVRAQR